MIRNLTESGDYYEGTADAWARYWEALNSGDYDAIQRMEEGGDPDFQYAP